MQISFGVYLVVILIGLNVCQPVVAAQDNAGAYQSHESIITAIQQFIATNFQYSDGDLASEVVPLDAQLQLAVCDKSPDVFTPVHTKQLTSAITVGVRCLGPHPWTVYTKVRLSLFKNVVLLRNEIPRGGIISENDVVLNTVNVLDLHPGYISDLSAAIGKQARRNLASGIVLGQDAIITLKVIQRGQLVVIRAQTPFLAVTMEGEAMSAGELGQRISVRNKQSGRVIQGIVLEPGVVEITQ